MTQDEQVEDIITMLDQFVANGGGHMNIQVEDPENIGEVKVETYNSSSCTTGNTACSVPTLHKGIDDTL
jgi:hypothetical protein